MMSMSDQLDVDLQDSETVDEIRLVTELMVVASMAPGDLEQHVIDGALGLDDDPGTVTSRHRPG
jgi:hypothetical protein